MIEAVVLTGGRSSRMGEDKARLLVEGEEQARRIVRLLAGNGYAVTVLGREPVEGAAFLRDAEDFPGPIEALRRFVPTQDMVFLCSCDLPRFDPAIAEVLAASIGESLAAAPEVDGYLQPLCALYRREAFCRLSTEFDCPMAWLKSLEPSVCRERDLEAAGVAPRVARGANTREEMEAALRAN